MKAKVTTMVTLCLALFAARPIAGFSADVGTQRVSVGITTLGFCGLKVSWEYAVAKDAFVGVFYQTSALMVAQGAFDMGEIGATAKWERDLGEGFFAVASIEAGYRYHGQNLGLAQSLFSRQGLRAGYRVGIASFGADLGWDQVWLANIRPSDAVLDTWKDRYEGCASGPDFVTIACPSTKFRLGGFASAALGDVGLSLAGGLLATPGSPVSGFDGMMFGHFPFYADLSVCLSL
jgi:hypothetical protein